MDNARRRTKGMTKPLRIDCNRGLSKLEDEVNMEPVSPSSVVFHNPNFNVHILATMGSKIPINVDDVKAKFPTTVLKHPRFSSVVEGDPCKGEDLKWVRTEVDLDKHFIVPKINHEDLKSPHKFLEEYLYNLSKTNLDRSKPLWEAHILHIEFAEDGVKGVAIVRTHHSLGDGTSLISLILALTHKTSDPESLPSIPGLMTKTSSHNMNKNNNSNSNMNKCFFWRWLMNLWMFLQLVWNTLTDVLLFLATALFLKDYSPLTNSPKRSPTPRRIVYKTFSLDDMKLVKNAMGCTINDVALGITHAGLSQYLSRKCGINANNSHGSTKEEWKKFNKQVRLRSLLLMNIRLAGGIQALSDMMEKDTNAKWGNSFGYVLLPFILGLRDDPLDYVREAKAMVDRKKNSLEVFYTHLIVELAMKLLGTKIASSMIDKFMAHTTIAFSNLVGPSEEIAFNGYPMAFLAPSSYGQPHEVMINFQSYINTMTLVLAVDEEVVPDPHQLCDDVVDSLKLVKDVVITQGLVKDAAKGVLSA